MQTSLTTATTTDIRFDVHRQHKSRNRDLSDLSTDNSVIYTKITVTDITGNVTIK